MSGASGLRVALVDDHAVVRAGYRRLLELEPDMEVVAEYGDADGAHAELAGAAGEGVDVLVLDLSMRGRSGLELLRRLQQSRPGVRVLIFTMHDSAALVMQCLQAGAAGFVTKNSEPQLLVDAVRRAARGETALSPDVAALVSQHALRRAPHHQLSGRELAVLEQLLEGREIAQIAVALDLSTKTVWNYQSQIRQKLGVGTMLELLQYAKRHGLSAR